MKEGRRTGEITRVKRGRDETGLRKVIGADRECEREINYMHIGDVNCVNLPIQETISQL